MGSHVGIHALLHCTDAAQKGKPSSMSPALPSHSSTPFSPSKITRRHEKLCSKNLFYRTFGFMYEEGDALSQIADATGEPVPGGTQNPSFVEISRSDEFVDTYTAAAKISCENAFALTYLEKCGFEKTKLGFFPTDLHDRGVPWWPSEINGGQAFSKREGDKGYTSALWLRGSLYFYIERH